MDNIISQAAIYHNVGLWQHPLNVIKAFRGGLPHVKCGMEIKCQTATIAA